MPQVHLTSLITAVSKSISIVTRSAIKPAGIKLVFGLTVCTAISVLAAGSSNAADSLSTTKGLGKIEVSEYSYDFGHMPQGASVVHEFIVKNIGKGVLNIVKVDPTCGCTTVPLKKAFLDPGDETGLRVEFKTGKYQGRVNKRIKVISTDQANSLIELYIRGIVGELPESIEMTGPAVVFGTVEVLKRKVDFKCVALYDVKLSVLSVADDFISASFSRDELKPQEKATLTIELKKNPPLGDFKTSITIECVGEKTERITIPITGIGYAR